MTIRLFARYYR